MFRNIETGKKNFVTSFDERKIGIVETLVFLLHYDPHRIINQRLWYFFCITITTIFLFKDFGISLFFCVTSLSNFSIHQNVETLVFFHLLHYNHNHIFHQIHQECNQS